MTNYKKRLYTDISVGRDCPVIVMSVFRLTITMLLVLDMEIYDKNSILRFPRVGSQNLLLGIVPVLLIDVLLLYMLYVCPIIIYIDSLNDVTCNIIN